MTSNMIYIVALCIDFKCPRKIHLNTQSPLRSPLKSAYVIYEWSHSFTGSLFCQLGNHHDIYGLW